MERQDTLPVLSDSEGSQSKLLMFSQETLNEICNSVGGVLQHVTEDVIGGSETVIKTAPTEYTSVVDKSNLQHLQPCSIDIRTESFMITPYPEVHAVRVPTFGGVSSFTLNQLLNSLSPEMHPSPTDKTTTDDYQPVVNDGQTDDNNRAAQMIYPGDNIGPTSNTFPLPQPFLAINPQCQYLATPITTAHQFAMPYQVVGQPYLNGNNTVTYSHNLDNFGGFSAHTVMATSNSQQVRLDRPMNNNSPQGGTPAPPSVSPMAPVGTVNDIPSNVPYPGQYGFEIFFTKAKEVASKKTISYTFSTDCNKLYVRQGAVCPINFKVTKHPPTLSSIRAMAIYSRPQDVGDVVKRCMNHTMEDTNSHHPQHLIRCGHNSAQYFEDAATSRHSVVIPWETPSPGSEYITGMYQFMCYSSCVGTINRRPMQIVFTLEHNGIVVGRQVVELRICACPGRDRQNDEEQMNPNKRKQQKVEKVTTITTVEPLPKKSKADNNTDEEEYTIKVKGRELYKLVNTIVQNYQLAKQYTDLVAMAPTLMAAAAQPQASQNVFQRQHSSSSSFTGAVASLQKPLAALASQKSAGQELPEDETPVSEWLKTVEMSQYLRNFYDHKYKTMVQLDNITLNTLERIGIPADDRDRLLAALLHWKSGRRVPSRLSGLSATPPLSATGASLKISKTTIHHSYKLPTKKSPKACRLEQESE